MIKTGRCPAKWVLLIGLLSQVFATSVLAEPYVLGLMGDSLNSDDGSYSGHYPNWVIQIQTLGELSIPPAYNVAQNGATAADLTNQYPTIVSLANADKINASVLTVGGNDTASAAAQFVVSGYNGAVFSAAMNTTVSQIEQAVNAVAATALPLIVANIPDIVITPSVQRYISMYNVPSSEIAIAESYLRAANAQIEAIALSKGYPVIDYYKFSQEYLTQPSLTIAGITFPNSSFFSSNDFDPSSLIDGFEANVIVYALNHAFGTNLSELSEQQIVENIGLQPLVAGPTYFDISPYVILPVPEPSGVVLISCGAFAFLFVARSQHLMPRLSVTSFAKWSKTGA